MVENLQFTFDGSAGGNQIGNGPRDLRGGYVSWRVVFSNRQDAGMFTAGDFYELVEQLEIIMVAREQNAAGLNAMHKVNGIGLAGNASVTRRLHLVPSLCQNTEEVQRSTVIVEIKPHSSNIRASS